MQLGIRVDPSGCGPEGPTWCSSVFRPATFDSDQSAEVLTDRKGSASSRFAGGLRSVRSGLAPPCSGWLAAAVTAAAAAVTAAAAAELSVLGLTWCQSARLRSRRCGSSSVLISRISGLQFVLLGLGLPSSDQMIRFRAVSQRNPLRPTMVRSTGFHPAPAYLL